MNIKLAKPDMTFYRLSRLYQLSEKAFSYTGTMAWNKLSSELKRSKIIQICKNKIKSFEILY